MAWFMGNNIFNNFFKWLKIFSYISTRMYMNLVLIKWYFTTSYTASTHSLCSYSFHSKRYTKQRQWPHIRQIQQAMQVITMTGDPMSPERRPTRRALHFCDIQSARPQFIVKSNRQVPIWSSNMALCPASLETHSFIRKIEMQKK